MKQRKAIVNLSILGSLTVVNLSCNFHETKSPQPKESDAIAQESQKTNEFEKLMNDLFEPSCIRCHNNGRAAVGVNLETFKSITTGNVDGKPLITPGNLQNSVIYQVVVSGEMPIGGKVAPEVIQLLARWIENGALESGTALNPVTKNSAPDTQSQSNEDLSANPKESDEVAQAGSDSQRGSPNTPPKPTPESSSTESPTPGNNEPSAPGQPSSPSSPNEGDNPANEPPAPAPDPATVPAPTPAPKFSFADVSEKLIQPYCLGCHEGEYAAANVDLSSEELILNAKREDGTPIPLIRFGDLQNSKMLQVILSKRMPLRGMPQPDAPSVEALKSWITTGGAP